MKFESDKMGWRRMRRILFATFFMAFILGGVKPGFTAKATDSQCRLVYKSNGEYVPVSSLGIPSYIKIERNKKFYLEYEIGRGSIAGSTVKTYVQQADGGEPSINTIKCISENEDYNYDVEESCAYIPISLESEQGSVKVYFDLTLADGKVQEEYDPDSGNAFYLELLGEYTISYDATGGTGEPDSQTKYTESALVLSSSEPVREGYIFKGWATSSATSEISYHPGEEYTENRGRTLYAVWELDLRPTVSAPVDQNVRIGESAAFSITAEGDYPDYYTYQWYWAKSQDGLGIAIDGETNTILTIPEDEVTAELDGIYYYCVVKDSYNDYYVPSSRARLTVYSPPSVTDPTEQKAKAGEAATFSVTVSGGNPSDYTYQWYYALSKNGAGTKIDGAVSSVYTVPASQVTAELDGRHYYCEVSNGIYNVTSSRAKLTVQSADASENNNSNNSGNGNNSSNSNSNNSGNSNNSSNSNSNNSGNDNNSNNNSTNNNSSNNGGSGNNGSNNGNKTQKEQKITASSCIREYGSKSFTLKAKTSGNGKLSYSSSNRKVATISSAGKVSVKNYGTAVITIRASKTSDYKEASKKINIKVVPKRVAIKKVKSPARSKIEIKWKNDKTVTGYELNLSPKSDFKSHIVKRAYKNPKERVVFVKAPSGKTYYFRIRSYKKVGKTKYYSKWSKVKRVKIQ